jgi:hypothetical protein
MRIARVGQSDEEVAYAAQMIIERPGSHLNMLQFMYGDASLFMSVAIAMLFRVAFFRPDNQHQILLTTGTRPLAVVGMVGLDPAKPLPETDRANRKRAGELITRARVMVAAFDVHFENIPEGVDAPRMREMLASSIACVAYVSNPLRMDDRVRRRMRLRSIGIELWVEIDETVFTPPGAFAGQYCGELSRAGGADVYSTV